MFCRAASFCRSVAMGTPFETPAADDHPLPAASHGIRRALRECLVRSARLGRFRPDTSGLLLPLGLLGRHLRGAEAVARLPEQDRRPGAEPDARARAANDR